jgi:hypothetical protein
MTTESWDVRLGESSTNQVEENIIQTNSKNKLSSINVNLA